MKQQILLVEEEESISHLFHSVTRKKDWNLKIVSSALQAVEILKQKTCDLLVCSLASSEFSSIDLMHLAKQLHPSLCCLLIGSEEQIDKSSSAIRLHGFSYLTKPFTEEMIEGWIEQLATPSLEQGGVIAKSPLMKHILSNVTKIAQSNASVFISGESGTGKEVIANAIHQLSLRSNKPFIRVNCAAIPQTLLESEFFGHEKGSFTGAFQKRIGRFELADLGTLLLDEISEISLELQPKLLRAIQEQEFERLGGVKPIQVDVRLISTSNRNMKETIEQKLFREDLYYRLNVVPIHLPPLRDRQEDIIPLAQYFLEKLCKENGKEKKILSSSAEDKLLSYSWPGNVRELANIIERTLVMHSGEWIQPEDLWFELSCPIFPKPKETSYLPGTLAEVEKAHILATLQSKNNNKTQAAKTLGISIRTLRNKLKQYQI